MKIVVDNAIPFLEGVFEPYAEVVYKGGNEIVHEDVLDADALIIRTRTRCDAQLLEGTSVKMIATATIGMDHIDMDYCAQHGIHVENAAGCNAGGVMQYVFSALYGVGARKGIKIEDGNFGMMTELEFSEEDDSLLAWEMLLDADGHRYCFVRKEKLEEERKIQDLSEDLPKVIESNEIESFALYFYNAGGTYELEESWKPGDYSWELERNEDGTYQMNFQISTDTSMAPETMEMLVESEFAAGLAKLLEAKNISGHNGYYLKDTQSESSYGLYVKYVSGERLRIRAEGTPAQECIFDLNALLDYASDKVVNEGW